MPDPDPMRAHLSTPAMPAATARRTWPSRAVPLLLFAAAMLLYAVNLGHLPHPDELYQIIPAESLLATGKPRIADGLYTRALAQTWIIAGSFRLFGHSLAVARLSSAVGIAGTVALLFAWLRRGPGPVAAWLGALGYGLSPFAVGTAHFARIYGVQTFAFLAACLLAHAAVPASRPPGPARARELWRKAGLLSLALLLLALAVHLQPTTLMGVAGLGLWAAGGLALPWLRDAAVPVPRKRLAVATALVLGLLLLAAAWATGLLGWLWYAYRNTPVFAEHDKNRFWYYFAWYLLDYPVLWLLTVPLAAAALAVWPRPASLASCVFAVGFVLNSFGGQKALNYIAYAQPFLFALWATGLAALWHHPEARRALPWAAGPVSRLTAGFLGSEARRGWLARGALLALLLASPAWVVTAAQLAGLSLPGTEPIPDWAAARPSLEPWLKRVPVVVTTEELGTLYFLGRYDIRFSPSKLGEIEAQDRREFAPDWRTGRAVISTVGSLGQVFDCYQEGLFLLASRQWGHAHLFSPEVQAFVRDHARPLPLPEDSEVTAYGWSHPEGYRPPAACASLPPMPGPGAGVRPH